MESSQSLQNDIEYLVDLEDSKSIFSTEDLLFISRRLWGNPNHGAHQECQKSPQIATMKLLIFSLRSGVYIQFFIRVS